MKKISLSLLILISLLFENCKAEKEQKISKKPNQSREIYTIQDSDREITVSLLGTVSHKNKAEVSSKVLGRVEKIFKEQGEKVSKGEALAKIETLNLELQLRKDEASIEVQTRQIDLSRAKYIQARQRVEKDLANIEKAKAEVEEAKANLDNLNRTYNNKKDLFEIGGVSETELKAVETALVSAETAYFKSKKNYSSIQVGYRVEDLQKGGIPVPKDNSKLPEAFVDLNTIIEKAELEMAKSNLKATQASIETTKLLMKESTLLSPLTGRVAVRSLYVGEATKEGQPVFVIVDESEVFLTFPVSESDLPFFQEGKYMDFTIDALGNDKERKGKIAIVSPILDSQSRTADIKVVYLNEDRKLKPGMFARAKYKYMLNEQGFAISKKGIILSEDKTKGKIFTVTSGDICFSKEVKVLSIENDKVMISGEISIGDKIVLGNLDSLSNGAKWNE